MAVRGVKPTPNVMKLVSSRSMHPDEPKVEKELHDAPDWLTPEQRKVWDERVEDCPSGMLGTADGDTLANYCVVVVEVVELQLQLRKLTMKERVIKTKKGNLIQHPLVGLRNKTVDRMTKLASELGFTPTSRSRIKVPKNGKTNSFTDHAAKRTR